MTLSTSSGEVPLVSSGLVIVGAYMFSRVAVLPRREPLKQHYFKPNQYIAHSSAWIYKLVSASSRIFMTLLLRIQLNPII